MLVARLGFLSGLASVLLVLAGPITAHLGYCSAFTGFQLFLLGLLLGVLALLLGLLGLFLTRHPQSRPARGRAVVASYIGAALTALLVYLVLSSSSYPAINDITTDVNNPPEFVHAETLPANRGRDLHYDKAKYAAIQERGYGTLEPLRLSMDPDQAYKEAATMASEMRGWTITYEDPKTHTIEGVAISPLFRFHDDFVIQVRSDASGSLVEMRSKSRDGKGDVGANYKRIKSFFRSLSGAGAPH